MLLRCSPFPKAVWTQIGGGSSGDGPTWAWAGESLRDPGLGAAPPQKKMLELACCSQHPLTPQVRLSGPAPAGPQSSFWNSSRRGRGGGRTKGVGCCFRSPPVARSPSSQLEGLEDWPEPTPLPSELCQPLPARRALERQASPNPLVSKPCQRPPEATLEPKAKEQKSKDEALDTVPTGPGGSREEELGGSPARTAKVSAFPTPPGWPPASACSPQDTQTPTQTGLGKLAHAEGSTSSNP